jgi:lipopolysaccharide/colanic/teichoic acid biosynthesis glycosyltransferase
LFLKINNTVPAHNEFYKRWGKRPFDLTAASLGLALLSPVMLAVALLVRVTSRGPVFFRQVRPGLGGRPFRLFKFRTMRLGADRVGAAVVVARDERLTLVGGLLRHTKLDEIPQLINVVLGDMSLVGPRPRPFENVHLELAEERALQTLRPGITSYATVYHHSEEAYCCQQEDPQAAYRELQLQKSHLDAGYLKDLSFTTDLKLILLTLLLILPGKSKPESSHFHRPGINPYSRTAQMLLEGIVFAMAVWLAYWLRFDGQIQAHRQIQRDVFMVILPLARLAAHRIFGIYDMVWRYANLVDGAMLVFCDSFVSGVLLLFRLLSFGGQADSHWMSLPLGVIVLEYLLVVCGVIGLRFLRRILYELNHRYQPWSPGKQRRILIVGAGLSGVEISQAIVRCPQLELVGFVDDDPAKQGRSIAGRRVLGRSENLSSLIREHTASDVILCAHSMSQGSLQEIHQCCGSLGVRTHVIPTLNQILGLDNVEPELIAVSTVVISGKVLQGESKVQPETVSSLSDRQESFIASDPATTMSQ